MTLGAIMLQSNLYGPAKEICRKVAGEVIRSDMGTDAIANSLHKRDALSTVSSVYQDFIAVLSAPQGDKESFKKGQSLSPMVWHVFYLKRSKLLCYLTTVELIMDREFPN